MQIIFGLPFSLQNFERIYKLNNDWQAKVETKNQNFLLLNVKSRKLRFGCFRMNFALCTNDTQMTEKEHVCDN